MNKIKELLAKYPKSVLCAMLVAFGLIFFLFWQASLLFLPLFGWFALSNKKGDSQEVEDFSRKTIKTKQDFIEVTKEPTIQKTIEQEHKNNGIQSWIDTADKDSRLQ